MKKSLLQQHAIPAQSRLRRQEAALLRSTSRSSAGSVYPIAASRSTQAQRGIDPWTPLGSRKPLLQFKLPSSQSRSILDMQQMLEDWRNKSTVAIATWSGPSGDAQRYWLDQGLETARVRHDQRLQSPPDQRDQRASLEPAYILGDRRLTPEAANAVESVVRTELLEVILKTMADSCMRHGYCTAELIIWYIVKQLTLPPDVNEVTMQKEIALDLRPSLQTARGNAAQIEPMQQDQAKCSSSSFGCTCDRDPQCCDPILSNHWQHLGLPLCQTSASRLRYYSRSSVQHAI